MGLSLSLGLTLGSAGIGGVPAWVPRLNGSTALLVLDQANNRGWFRGRNLGTEAAAMTAAGFASSGITRTGGPLVVGSELVSNGTFDTTTDPWTTVSPITLAAASGAMQITNGSGSTQAVVVSIPVSVTLGHNYRAAFSSAGSAVTRRAILLDDSLVQGTSIVNDVAAVGTYSQSATAVSGSTRFGLRVNNLPNGQVATFDNASLKESQPLAGWAFNGNTIVIAATAPAASATDEVLLQIDGDSDRHRIRLVRLSTDLLQLSLTTDSGLRFTLDVGTVADGADFTVAISFQFGSYQAALNGGATLSASSGFNWYPPGDVLRLGRSLTGETWTGSIRSMSVLASVASSDDLSYLSRLPPRASPSWVPRGSDGQPFDFFADTIAGRFWRIDQTYASFAAWLTAMGGTVVSGANQFTFPWDTVIGTYLFEGAVPSTAANSNFIQIDDGTDSNTFAFRRLTTTESFSVVRLGSAQVGQGAAVVASNMPTRLAASLVLNNFAGSIEGAAVLTDTSVLLPTVTTFRVGNNAAGDRPILDGQVWKIGGSRMASGGTAVQALATPEYFAVTGGDSYMAGAANIGINTSAVTVSKKYITTAATGGNTLEMGVADLEAHPLVGKYPTLFCDGSPNSFDTLANDMARYARVMAASKGRAVIAAPLPRVSQAGAENTASRDLTAALLAAYPGRVVNIVPIADAINPGSGGNCNPALLQADGIHMDTTLANAVAAAMIALTV